MTDYKMKPQKQTNTAATLLTTNFPLSDAARRQKVIFTFELTDYILYKTSNFSNQPSFKLVFVLNKNCIFVAVNVRSRYTRHSKR